MAIFFLIILVLISVWMLGWGLSRPERIYQLPTMAGSVWLLYIVPLALGVVRNPYLLPAKVISDGGLEMALLMSILCALASFWGYSKEYRLPARGNTRIVYSNQRIFLGGVTLILIGLTGFHLLAQLTGGYLNYYSTQGNYALDWRGLPVFYSLFMMLLYPGVTLCLLSALRKPSLFKWMVIVLGSLVPLANVLFLGRRSQLFMILIVYGMSFFLVRDWLPKRPIILAGILMGALVVILAPGYRTHSQIGADHSQIAKMDIGDAINKTLSGKGYNEFQYVVVQLPATNEVLEFGLGSGFYNTFVAHWVPRFLVGESFKRSLLLPAPNYHNHMLTRYLWLPNYGSNPTGITQAFCEFWFFGAIMFYWIGRGFKYLWVHATKGDSLPHMIFYIGLAPQAMESVFGVITAIPSDIFLLTVFVYPIIKFSQIRMRRKY